jgi:hypothetical protein
MTPEEQALAIEYIETNYGSPKNACKTCPVDVDTCGDLPSLGEMMALREKYGADWACHSRPKKICTNFMWYLETKGMKKTGFLLHREGGHLDYTFPHTDAPLKVVTFREQL